jgi:uncharacterized Zn-finger protein
VTHPSYSQLFPSCLIEAIVVVWKEPFSKLSVDTVRSAAHRAMLVSCQPAPPFASTSQHFYQPVHPDAQALLPFLPFDSKPFSATDDHTDAGREVLRSKRFACSFEGCGKTYARPGRLEEHVRSHTGEVRLFLPLLSLPSLTERMDGTATVPVQTV